MSQLEKNIEWVEGKHIPLLASSYRHRVVVGCSRNGRQKARFANGEFPYFAYMELLDGKGNKIQCGNNIVPSLPDGRLIMVVEKRPAQAVYQRDKRVLRVRDENSIVLSPEDSVEFPGGAIEPGESFTSGFIRELSEETGVEKQSAILYRRLPPVYPFGSDLSVAMFLCVIELSAMKFDRWVVNDGGLTVIALSRDEVENAIYSGIINSGQAALLGWGFYNEVMMRDGDCCGYISKEEVKLVRPK